MKKIFVAMKLYLVGFRLEKARGKLERLYNAKEPNDSERLCRARERFNRLCDRWNKLEADFHNK